MVILVAILKKRSHCVKSMASSKRPSADDNRETKRARTFMQPASSDIACLYLINTAKREGDATVYKIEDRFDDEFPSYGVGALLDTVILVPVEKLSEAKVCLHHSIANEACFSYDKENEEITLDSADRKALRAVMQTIANKCNGSLMIQASVHQREMKDQEFKYELRIKDLERVVAVFEVQKEIEKQRLEKQMEIEKLRLENAKLKATAEANTKDRENEVLRECIRQLEETNLRLSKCDSEPEYRP